MASDVDGRVSAAEFKEPMEDDDVKGDAKIKEIEADLAKVKASESKGNAAPQYPKDILAQTLFFGGFERKGDGQAEVEWLNHTIKGEHGDHE